MKLIIYLTICILTVRVESQLNLGRNQQYNEQYTDNSRTNYPANNNQNFNAYVNQTVITENRSQFQFGPITQNENEKVSERDSYLQAIKRNDDPPHQQLPTEEVAHREEGVADERIYFIEPSVELSPPPFAESASPNYYSTKQSNAVFLPPANGQETTGNIQETVTQQIDNSVSNVTLTVSNFGLRSIKIASQLKSGNVIMSPISIATLLALLQQGATGEAQEQISRSLEMTPAAAVTAFSNVAVNVTKRNSDNILSIANNIFVSDTFDLNNMFKRLAIRSFWSEVSIMNFANPSEALKNINSWVARKTNQKITNLLAPGAVSPETQLVLVNAVYFKGIWETKFLPKNTEIKAFRTDGEKKMVPFMHTRHSFQVGYDPNTRARVVILPFEGHQYSLMVILPKRTDTVANVLSTLTVEQLLSYHSLDKNAITVEIPKFTLKTDIFLNPVLQEMGITNIFGSKSGLAGIGLYGTTPPQISNAIHSAFLSIDEEGVTAAAASAVVAVALSYDDSAIVFRADRPFIAVLWDHQLSIPIFMAKIEDPS